MRGDEFKGLTVKAAELAVKVHVALLQQLQGQQDPQHWWPQLERLFEDALSSNAAGGLEQDAFEAAFSCLLINV